MLLAIIDEIDLTVEFLDFAHQHAQEIYEDLNNMCKYQYAPRDPNLYDPFFNPDGFGKEEEISRYFMKTSKSPIEDDDDKSEIMALMPKLQSTGEKAC